MKISLICFTRKGYEVMKRAEKVLGEGFETGCACKCSAMKDECPEAFVSQPLEEWTKERFAEKAAIVFIGAAGIAVRAIAGCVNNKLNDSPVIVMDDNAKYVIPILSGHVGGANELAEILAKKMGALPVITTATDVNHHFAVDVFAVKNDLRILNKPGIAAVSSAVLEGKPIKIAVDARIGIDKDSFSEFEKEYKGEVKIVPYEDETAMVRIGWDIDPDIVSDNNKVLFLMPEDLVLGIGCKRGKSFDEIREFALRTLESSGLSPLRVGTIASIDIKKDEEGIIKTAESFGVPFVTYRAEQLNSLKGSFHDSDFVMSRTGTGNVSERSACFAAGEGAKILVPKQAENGVTAAIVKINRRLEF